MKTYFAYVRVSTQRQGEGVSLTEQRAAIERYAESRSLPVTRWFEERETAAKRGRPVFRAMLGQLENHDATGLIIHKIDRSARNLRDWADLGELIDTGIDVRFAHDNLDLDTRGGRLAADIQAIIAADYIRNLRDEVKKGLYGRLRQGLYPLPAPIGYLDRGPGRIKAIDPAAAPLVVDAFERFATGTYTKGAILEDLRAQGLRNAGGSLVTYSSLSRLLTNPFYAGTLQLRIDPTTYQGQHQPLISRELFDQVQSVLRGLRPTPTTRARHLSTYRGLLRCSGCGRTLVGEIKKGHTYYRCHQITCRGTCLREEAVEDHIRSALANICVSIGPAHMEPMRDRWTEAEVRRALHAQGSSPRIMSAAAKTDTVRTAVAKRIAAFEAVASYPRRLFDQAPALQRRELVEIMLRMI